MYRMINGANWSATLFCSKCVLFEVSTPFLNIYKSTRKSWAGALFVLSFFLSRVVWLGYLAVTGMRVSLNVIEHATLLSFTALNYYWFVEILAKVLKHSEPSKMHEE